LTIRSRNKILFLIAIFIFTIVLNPIAVKASSINVGQDLTIEKLSAEAYYTLGSQAKITIRATNSSDEMKRATLIVALYNMHNKLVDYVVGSQNIEVAKSAEVTGMIKIPSSGVSKLKYFVWDSLEGMRPLCVATEIPIYEAGSWQLIFQDEFDGKNGTSPSEENWNYEIGNGNGGWGNNELQSYTNSTENVFQNKGNLVIKALKNESTGEITSGRIKTAGKFSMKYGKVEVKAKLPVGTGLWPAVWMMPEKDAYGGWAASGEIDIMENRGRLPEEVYGTLHYGASWPNNKYSGSTYTFPEGESVADFHTYGIEWEPGEIRWYVDGKLYQTQDNWDTKDSNGEKYAFPAPFDQNFYLMLNLAFGGNFDGGQKDFSVLPGEMVVDYIRAYELAGGEYKTPTEPNVAVESLPSGAKVPTADGNYIYNGDFKDSNIKENADGSGDFGNGWNFVHIPDAAGNGNVLIDTISEANYAKVNVTAAGTQNYAVQLIQNTTLGKGRWYKLDFDSKSDTNRKIAVKLSGGASRGWASYSPTYEVNLTGDFQHVEKVFQMQGDSDIAARLEFELGLSTSPVWVGNVSLKEVPAPVIDHNASKEPLIDGNYIYNGAFDKGNINRLTYWNLNKTDGAIAKYYVDENTRALNIEVTNSGVDASKVTIDQKGIQLTKNNQFKLTFKAKAETDRTMKIKFISKDGTMSYVPETDINLKTTMETFELPFTMTDKTDLESQLVFMLGGNNSKVYIDDVSLIRTSIDYSLVDLYPLKNGDFSKGLESWKPYPNIGDGADSAITAENGEAKISINKVGPNPWSILLNQEGFKLTKGVEYVVGFDVRASLSRNMEFVIDNAAYYRYLSNIVEAPIGTEMKHYEYTLKIDKDDIVNLKLLMGKTDNNVSASPHDIYIDNVMCEVKDAKFKSSILKNGTFEGTLEPWKSWSGDGGSAEASLTSDETMKIAVTNAGPNSWSVQELQEGIKFEKGQKYSVSFKAKAEQARKINVNIGKALTTDPWFIPYANTQTFDLTDNMQEYNFQFTMNEDTYDNGKMVFEIGNVTGGNATTNVYIDDVAINKATISIDPPPTETPVTIENSFIVVSNNNMLKDGSFEDGAIVGTDNSNWKAWWGDQWSGASSGAVTAENGKMKIHLTSVGGASYSPQVFQEGFKLENEKTYVVSFKAKADTLRKMNINIGKALSSDPWFKSYAPSKTVDIATTEQQYTYLFKVTEATDSNLKMVFELGNIAGGNAVTDVYLDDISIQEVASGTMAEGVVITNSSAIVKDANFDEGVMVGTDSSNWKAWWGDQWSGVSTGNIVTESGKLKIHLTSIGGASYSPQIFQEGLKLEKGKTYVISFDAKADALRKINVNLGKALSTDPWFTAYAPSKTVDVDMGEKQYIYGFKVTETTDSNLKIVFEVGNVAGGNAITDIYLDNIYIQEVIN
jgi:beta-glucanase (GH16 family)